MARPQFVTNDGKVFDTEEEANEYEKSLNITISFTFVCGNRPKNVGEYLVKLNGGEIDSDYWIDEELGWRENYEDCVVAYAPFPSNDC